MAFALAHSGTMNGPAGATTKICVARARVSKVYDVFNTTQSGSGQAAAAAASKRFTYRVSGSGWVELVSDSSKVHITGNMASISGTITGKVNRIIVQKNMRLHDVTSATDVVPRKVFEEGLITYHGTVQGLLESDDTILDDDQNTTPSTLIIPLGSGTLSASAIVSQEDLEQDHSAGGPNGLDYNFQYSGTVTNTGTIFSIDSYSMSLDGDNGQTMAATLMLEQIAAHCDYRRGGPVPCFFNGVCSGEVTFT